MKSFCVFEKNEVENLVILFLYATQIEYVFSKFYLSHTLNFMQMLKSSEIYVKWHLQYETLPEKL
jgi:hypothetical protein